MLVEVKRFEFGTTYTIGKLYIDGVYQCYTLEDVVRSGPKVAGATAIPTGEYKLVIDFSNRFQQRMPHILNVPSFEGVRIHCGNTSSDTEGCILLGSIWPGKNSVTGSRLAFNKVFPLLEDAKDITIVVK